MAPSYKILYEILNVFWHLIQIRLIFFSENFTACRRDRWKLNNRPNCTLKLVKNSSENYKYSFFSRNSLEIVKCNSHIPFVNSHIPHAVVLVFILNSHSVNSLYLGCKILMIFQFQCFHTTLPLTASLLNNRKWNS